LRIPRFELAEIPEAKLLGYLLSETHPEGQGKASFFRRLGYSSAAPHVLRQALIRLIATAEVSDLVRTMHGTKYVVDGYLGEGGTRALVRTIWIIHAEGKAPRFVTAYPAKESQ